MKNKQVEKPSTRHRVGTYSQIYIQVVFSVRGWENLLHKSWRESVFKYISGIITAKKQKSIIVNGCLDHIHILIGFHPSACLSDLVRDIKNNSSRFINQQGFIKGHFSWQEGFGAFSYSHSQIKNVYNYILRQKDVHPKKSFREEYLEFLRRFEVSYEDQYLFDWIDPEQLKNHKED